MAEDVAATLKRVAAIGYAELEFAGYFGKRPSEIRRMVADLGVTAPSSHVDALAARSEPLPLIDGALEAGHKFLVIAWAPPETRKTLEDWKAWADVCNRFAAECHKAGLRFCRKASMPSVPSGPAKPMNSNASEASKIGAAWRIQ